MTDFQELTDRINDSLEDVVYYYGVDLKKAGANYKACCPFHQEKTPSFMVSPAKGIYKCFGCGQGGDAISFIQEQESLKTRQGKDFVDILKVGAKILNVDFQPKELTDKEREEQRNKESLKTAHTVVARYYAQNLLDEKNRHHLGYLFSRIVPKPKPVCETIPPAKTFKGEVTPIRTAAFLQPVKLHDINEQFLTFLQQWQLGWSSEHQLIGHAKKQGLKTEILEQCGIVKHHKGTGNYYDFFSERLTFPIFDTYGNPIAFSCRTRSSDKNVAKYKNSPETPIYQKGHTFYGLHAAKRAIKEKNSVYLVEGNTDVLRQHWLSIDNTVAALGTALTAEQIELLKRFTNDVTLLYDGDAAGQKALKKNGTALLKASFNVYMIQLPEGEDPGGFFCSTEQFLQYEQQHKRDFFMYIAEEAFRNTGTDVRKRQAAIEEVVELLYPMSDLVRNLYIQELMKLSGTKSKEWSSLIVRKRKAAERVKRKNQNYSYINGMTEEQEAMLENYNFYYSTDNKMFFKGEGSAVHEKGRFTIMPLFHIESDNGDVRKLFKLKNFKNEERVLETDITSLQSPVKLCEKLEEKGNFLFEGGKIELTRLKRWLYDMTKYSKSIDVLGWHKAGFWAWADGIIDQEGKFSETDEFGIVKHNEQFYYIPAYSLLNENTNNYSEQKKFAYTIQDITLNDWAQRMLDVYGNNAMLSIASYFCALFSDHIFTITKSLPLINFFGPKGTGKTEHAFSISALFGNRLKEVNINNATQSRLSSHVNDYRNSLVLIDEYKNSLHPTMIESLKMLYNRQIRARNTIGANNRIVADNTLGVNSMIMIAGQEMMTADVALFSRAIFLPTYKTKYDQDEKQKFNELKHIESAGLSHFTSELMKMRIVFEKQFEPEYNKVSRELKEAVELSVDERLLQNHATILTALKLVSNDFKLPFSYQDTLNESVTNIKQQYKLMTSSNEISGFFKVMTFMFERQLIKDGPNFRIKSAVQLGKWQWEQPKKLLILRWDGLYQHYAEIGRKTGENVMPEESLKYYLENSDPYIDKHRLRFTGIGARWAMVFDYEKCEALGLHLNRDDDGKDTDETDGLIEASQIVTVTDKNGQKIQTNGEEVPF